MRFMRIDQFLCVYAYIRTHKHVMMIEIGSTSTIGSKGAYASGSFVRKKIIRMKRITTKIIIACE